MNFRQGIIGLKNYGAMPKNLTCQMQLWVAIGKMGSFLNDTKYMGVFLKPFNHAKIDTVIIVLLFECAFIIHRKREFAVNLVR